MRSNGDFVRLEAGGSVLGAFPGICFAQDEIELHDGDRLILFTDGLTEAVDASNEQFGEQRLIELLHDHRNRSAGDLKEILFNAVEEFCGNTFRDDAALMVLEIE